MPDEDKTSHYHPYITIERVQLVSDHEYEKRVIVEKRDGLTEYGEYHVAPTFEMSFPTLDDQVVWNVTVDGNTLRRLYTALRNMRGEFFNSRRMIDADDTITGGSSRAWDEHGFEVFEKEKDDGDELDGAD